MDKCVTWGQLAILTVCAWLTAIVTWYAAKWFA